MTTLRLSPCLDSAITLEVLPSLRLTFANTRISRPSVPTSSAPSA